MKKLVLGIILFSYFILPLFAEIPIYCPSEKIHLYNYQKDEIKGMEVVRASDFIPVNETIPQPDELSPMVCPFCKAPLNGFEYQAWFYKAEPPKFYITAVTMMTKGEEGIFYWTPYNLTIEEINGY